MDSKMMNEKITGEVVGPIVTQILSQIICHKVEVVLAKLPILCLCPCFLFFLLLCDLFYIYFVPSSNIFWQNLTIFFHLFHDPFTLIHLYSTNIAA